MKGLLLMNCYNMKMYLRQYLIMLVIFLVFGVSTGNSFYIMGMSLVVGINISFLTFSFGEAGGYAYLLSGPVTRKAIVQTKYLFQLVGAAFIRLCSGVGELFNRLVTGRAEETWLLSIISILGIYFLFMGILVPVTYRYGTEKARIVSIGIIAAPMILVFLGARLMQIPILLEILDRLSWLFTQEQMVFFIVLVIFVASVLIMGVSYLISMRIFEKTEF